ncbi:hypothetical protein [Gorillibacterium timonense]|uniref:hypothetical protein n=1 Tax=Gorillibacterium timonense TaxID=1689269 RepID=UPI00071C4979|nr:hypothetical protein [Gorillibacterium timonense]
MNIGQTLRSLMGELRTGEARTLELRPGQIVRGVVSRMTTEQQATVTINGVSVQAYLEAGLKPGEAALLQVQPPGADGAIRLKLAQNAAQLPDFAASSQSDDPLSSLGLVASKGNRQAAQLLQEAGLPLTKAGIQETAAALKNIPAGIGKEGWLDTIKLALGRALPLSQGALESLHSVTAGPGLDRTFAALADQIRAALDGEAGAGKNSGLLRQLGQLLEQLAATVEEGVQGKAQAAVGNANGRADSLGVPIGREASGDAGSLPGASQTGRENGKPGVTGQPAGTNGSGGAAEGETGAFKNAGSAGGAGPSGGIGNLANAGNSNHSANSIAPGNNGNSGSVGNASNLNMNSTESNQAGLGLAKDASMDPTDKAEMTSKGVNPSEGSNADSSAQSSRTSERAERGSWLSRMLSDLGVEHEQKLANLPVGTDIGRGSMEHSGDASRQTLKELLLQVGKQDDLPLPLKEAAAQALQQVTGQQLLLSGDRTQQLAHLTVMIPFYNEQGRQTAAVHVESRRNNRGELDADNCRLLFDLSMRTLGPLLIDVQVADRAVGIRILNDHGQLKGLLDAGREELVSTMEESGYRLSYLHSSDYPNVSQASTEVGESQTDSAIRDQLDFHRKPYKSMDVRV